MSWLARSLVNSLRAADSDEDDDRQADRGPVAPPHNSPPARGDHSGTDEDERQPASPGRGVKEDLSELTKTLSRQFWGVASFLAPPPAASAAAHPDDPSAEEVAAESPRMTGIRSDFAEIGGRFRSGISMLSSNKAVSEISKIASTFLPFGSEDADEDEERVGDRVEAIGVTEEVLAFARNISMHPETWLDFPLLPDDDESDDFDISDAQQEHALAVESLAPRLAALRIELCPSHMSDGCFWKIYFVLLHPRLNKHDAELLSTPQIVEARRKLQGLQNQNKQGSERTEGGVLYRKEAFSPSSSEQHITTSPSILNDTTTPKTHALEEPTSVPVTDFETEKHPVITTEVKIIDKSVIEEDQPVQTKHVGFSSGNSKITIHKYDEDGDEWLEEDTGEMTGIGVTPIPLDEEDVSFSDLEEDDDQSVPKNYRTATAADHQEKESRDWVALNKSSKGVSSSSPNTKESNEWLDFDDITEV